MSSPTKTESAAPNNPDRRQRRRQTFYGLGDITGVEKNVYGRFFDDVVYTFAEVSVLSLPALWWVLLFVPVSEYFGTKNATLLAWLTMAFGVALFRGRLVSPPKTDFDGWIGLAPSLVVFRLFYYNIALGVIGSVAGFIGTDLGSVIGSIVVAIGLAASTIAAFPWATGQFQQWLAEWDPQM